MHFRKDEMNQQDLLPFCGTRNQIHFHGGPTVIGTLSHFGPQQFAVTVGQPSLSAQWQDGQVVEADEIAWVRPWPPERAHEQWLFKVASALPEFDAEWDDDGLGVTISDERGNEVSVNVEPGEVEGRFVPFMTFSDAPRDTSDGGPIPETRVGYARKTAELTVDAIRAFLRGGSRSN